MQKKEIPGHDTEGITHLLTHSSALYVVRIILPAGATVRNGVEIDVAEQVRNLPQHTVCEIKQRVITQGNSARSNTLLLLYTHPPTHPLSSYRRHPPPPARH